MNTLDRWIHVAIIRCNVLEGFGLGSNLVCMFIEFEYARIGIDDALMGTLIILIGSYSMSMNMVKCSSVRRKALGMC